MDDDPKRAPRDRENDWPRSILMVLGVLLLVAGFYLFNWVRTASHAAELFNKISSPSQQGLITSPDTLVHRLMDQNIAGATVLLNLVRVDSVLGDYVFMIDLGDRGTIPVVLLGEITGRQSEKRVAVEAGQMTRIFGFLLPLDEVSMITNPDFIDESERSTLLSNPYYIGAIRVVVH